MQIELINYGGRAPERAHYNDAGADVFANTAQGLIIPPHTIKKVPLGFGLKLPDGFVGYVVPRSGMSSNKGITAEVVPIDSGYTGEVHAILYNANDTPYTVNPGDKIAQLVIHPVILADFTYDKRETRGNHGFGSTGN